jgi:hypothetical protein
MANIDRIEMKLLIIMGVTYKSSTIFSNPSLLLERDVILAIKFDKDITKDLVGQHRHFKQSKSDCQIRFIQYYKKRQ